MKTDLDVMTARMRHHEADERLAEATQRLVGMCRLKLCDVESIQEQACVVAGLVCSERDTRLQLAEVEKRAHQG